MSADTNTTSGMHCQLGMRSPIERMPPTINLTETEMSGLEAKAIDLGRQLRSVEVPPEKVEERNRFAAFRVALFVHQEKKRIKETRELAA